MTAIAMFSNEESTYPGRYWRGRNKTPSFYAVVTKYSMPGINRRTPGYPFEEEGN